MTISQLNERPIISFDAETGEPIKLIGVTTNWAATRKMVANLLAGVTEADVDAFHTSIFENDGSRLTNSPEFVAARNTLTKADLGFREAFIAEVKRVMPEGVEAVLFYINDTPRLTVGEMLNRHGISVGEYELSDVFDFIDTAASELGVRDYEDADIFLDEYGTDGEQFVIRREDQQ